MAPSRRSVGSCNDSHESATRSQQSWAVRERRRRMRCRSGANRYREGIRLKIRGRFVSVNAVDRPVAEVPGSSGRSGNPGRSNVDDRRRECHDNLGRMVCCRICRSSFASSSAVPMTEPSSRKIPTAPPSDGSDRSETLSSRAVSGRPVISHRQSRQFTGPQPCLPGHAGCWPQEPVRSSLHRPALRRPEQRPANGGDPDHIRMRRP